MILVTDENMGLCLYIFIDRACVSAFTNVHRLFKVRAQTVASNTSMYFKKYVCLWIWMYLLLEYPLPSHGQPKES